MLGGDHIYDLNDQEGQTLLLEMPRRSTEFHYTEQIVMLLPPSSSDLSGRITQRKCRSPIFTDTAAI